MAAKKDDEPHSINAQPEVAAVVEDTLLGADENSAKKGASKVSDDLSKASTSNKRTTSSKSGHATNPSNLGFPCKKYKTLDDLIYWDFCENVSVDSFN